jgi:hypothetical protein
MSAAIQFTRYFIVITKCTNDIDECQLHVYLTQIRWGAWNWMFQKSCCILFHQMVNVSMHYVIYIMAQSSFICYLCYELYVTMLL